MTNVVLSIGGRSFAVACAEGEESHIAALGQMIDDKISEMGGNIGQNEGRMLLFAALLMADELHEARTGTGAAPTVPLMQENAATRLETIAGQLENLAARLERQGASA